MTVQPFLLLLAAITITELPNPSGAFGIARTGYHWIDSTGNRELMVYVWYPTSQKRPATTAPYFPGATQLDNIPEIHAYMGREFKNIWPVLVSGEVVTHAAEAAPPAKSPKHFPVVIFSHGNGSTGFNYTALLEDLVSHGYVVAAIEHPATAIVVLFPDGRTIRFGEGPAAPGQISAGINEGAEDVRFVLSQMTQLNRSGPLAGAFDLTRAADMGHSAGAEFSARACQLDSRFKACVDLDGAMVPIAALPIFPDGATMKQPLLFLEADHPPSQMGGTPAQQAEYFRKKEEQLQSCPPGSYDVVLKSPGIAHPSFSDVPLLFAGKSGWPERTVVLHNLELIETFVRAFLDKNLKQQESPLLDETGRPTDRPGNEATLKHYGR